MVSMCCFYPVLLSFFYGTGTYKFRPIVVLSDNNQTFDLWYNKVSVTFSQSGSIVVFLQKQQETQQQSYS